MADRELTIGQVAQKFNLTLRALRFWEIEKLISPERMGNVRLYGPREISRIGVIVQFRDCGMGIAQIRELLEMVDRGESIKSKLSDILAGLEEDAYGRLWAISKVSNDL